MVAFTGQGAQTARQEARQMQQHLEGIGRLADDQLQAELSSFKQARQSAHALLSFSTSEHLQRHLCSLQLMHCMPRPCICMHLEH